MRFRLLLTAAFLCACRASVRVQIPASGFARSADGHFVAFVRPTPGRLVATSLGDEEATELWLAAPDGSNARRLVVGTAADSVEHALARFSSPAFSPDGTRLYFLSRAWVTSDAVHVVDVMSGRERFVAPGNSLEVIGRGEFAGCLLVAQHGSRDSTGSSDSIWLLRSDGKPLGIAADAALGIDAQLAKWRAAHVPPKGSAASTRAPSNERCS